MSVFDDLLDGKEVLNEISSKADDHIHMCSFWQDELDNMCSYRQYDTCGDCCVTAKSELVEVLEFTHFYEHFTFEKTDWSERGKHLKKYIRVIVAVELDTVGAK